MPTIESNVSSDDFLEYRSPSEITIDQLLEFSPPPKNLELGTKYGEGTKYRVSNTEYTTLPFDIEWGGKNGWVVIGEKLGKGSQGSVNIAHRLKLSKGDYLTDKTTPQDPGSSKRKTEPKKSSHKKLFLPNLDSSDKYNEFAFNCSSDNESSSYSFSNSTNSASHNTTLNKAIIEIQIDTLMAQLRNIKNIITPNLTQKTDAIEFFLPLAIGKPLKTLKNLNIQQKINIAYLSLIDLQRLEQCQVIHRDLHPANIIVNISKNGNINDVSIIDFSLSDFATEINKNPKGMIYYRAPETTGKIAKPIGYASDVYSIGLVLLELFLNDFDLDEYPKKEALRQELEKQMETSSQEKAKACLIADTIFAMLKKDPDERMTAQTAYGKFAMFQTTGKKFTITALSNTAMTKTNTNSAIKTSEQNKENEPRQTKITDFPGFFAPTSNSKKNNQQTTTVLDSDDHGSQYHYGPSPRKTTSAKRQFSPY